MKQTVLILSLILWSNLVTPVYAATNWCLHANNVGCFLMEDATTETDESVYGNDLSVVSSPNSIPLDADVAAGASGYSDNSRDWEVDDTEYLQHANNLETDITGADAQVSMVAWIKQEATCSATAKLGHTQFHVVRLATTRRRLSSRTRS